MMYKILCIKSSGAIACVLCAYVLPTYIAKALEEEAYIQHLELVQWPGSALFIDIYFVCKIIRVSKVLNYSKILYYNAQAHYILSKIYPSSMNVSSFLIVILFGFIYNRAHFSAVYICYLLGISFTTLYNVTTFVYKTRNAYVWLIFEWFLAVNVFLQITLTRSMAPIRMICIAYVHMWHMCVCVIPTCIIVYSFYLYYDG